MVISPTLTHDDLTECSPTDISPDKFSIISAQDKEVDVKGEVEVS